MTGATRRSKVLRRITCVMLAAWCTPGLAQEAPAGGQKEKAAVEEKKVDPAVAEIDAFIAAQKVDTSKPDWKRKLAKPPKVSFDAERRYLWKLDTNKGPIVIELWPDVAPMHVSSTIYLTRLGFYDGTIFHRVIPGFMAQGGDPTGTGMGGPGYQYPGEFEHAARARHDAPGVLSMANAGPGTDGSQFFITFVPTPHLDGNHTVFGRVSGGRRTLEELEQAGSPSGRTKERLEIRAATIEVE